jgi:hypothetical protein|eukprot:COSAG02_NODE_363_length_23785_cov_21.830828_15_plen_83_part_00
MSVIVQRKSWSEQSTLEWIERKSKHVSSMAQQTPTINHRVDALTVHMCNSQTPHTLIEEEQRCQTHLVDIYNSCPCLCHILG